MACIPREGDLVPSRDHRYRIVKEIRRGGFATSFKATDEHGAPVFFKQYKSPSVRVPWFKDYFQYEDELNRRLRMDAFLKSASVFANEVFLGKVCDGTGKPRTSYESIYQVFPFVEGNTNLEDMLDKGEAEFGWKNRLYASAVFAFALSKLHDANIVHCDLKPENVQMRHDPSILMKYKPLIIDMDWSILSDRRAPWHGQQAYVGTVGYMSPEHLRKGECPCEASDVFTAAIIISQLLTGSSPFASHLDADRAELDAYVLSGKNDFLSGGVPFKGVVSSRFEGLLLQALSVDKNRRPPMAELHAELLSMCQSLGRTGLPPKRPEVTGAGSGGTKVTPPKKIPPSQTRLCLTGDSGSFDTGTSFVLGQKTLGKVSSQARFADGNRQFEVCFNAGSWTIVGNDGAINKTTLNGAEVGSAPLPLKAGDVIALLGKSGKTAMEVRVSFL